MGKHWHEVLPKGYDHHIVDMEDKKVRSGGLKKPPVEKSFDEEPNFSDKDAYNHIRKNKSAKTITFHHGTTKSKEDVKKITGEHARATFRERYSSDDGWEHALLSRGDGPEIYHDS